MSTFDKGLAVKSDSNSGFVRSFDGNAEQRIDLYIENPQYHLIQLFPNNSALVLVGTTNTQTLTNKTLTSPTISDINVSLGSSGQVLKSAGKGLDGRMNQVVVVVLRFT